MPRLRPSTQATALAITLVVLGQAELWLLPSLDTELVRARTHLLPFAVLVPAALVLRTGAPLAAVLVAAGALVAQAIMVAPAMLLTQLAALLIAVYTVGAHGPLPRALAGLVAACTAPAALALRTDATVQETASIAVFATAPWLAGRVIARVRAYAARLEKLTAELERERERSAALAVAEERGHIARELHDILAHGLGVMTLQAGGARRMLRRDPDRAHAALVTIEDCGRQALAEVRRLLDTVDPGPGVGAAHAEHARGRAPQRLPVGAEGPPPGLVEVQRPQPSLADVGSWLRRTVVHSHPVSLHVEGDPRSLPPGLDLTAFRIVQEAVTNAHKHAPGAATSLRVRYSGDAVELEVANERGEPGPAGPPAGAGPPGRGRGLIGMRERVAMFGGSLETGPTDDGGFLVRARLPLEPAR
ncbi:sensor histidine kinase [Georgenia yuyongxinii]|uniref:histidine kinase n=1 Tax=Georgenia yuyongxinii TaxID=2589797 RepID=A0A552WTX3_9MICO|nr:histidine kinase [Georgenia yuyongxinii]TRW46135.1 hypothetical protein FJ693_06770 [Georgenia yuyongxinii]